jgi:hypothetical protein
VEKDCPETETDELPRVPRVADEAEATGIET